LFRRFKIKTKVDNTYLYLIPYRKKPSEILEEQLRKKEMEFNLVKEVCENDLRIEKL